MKNLRPLLAVTVALLSAGTAPYEAAAQVVAAPVRAPVVAPNVGPAALGLRTPALSAPSLGASVMPTLAPSFAPAFTPGAALPRAAASAAALRANPAAASARSISLGAPVVEAAAVSDLALIGNLSAPTALDAAGARGTLEVLGGRLESAKAGRGSAVGSLELAFDGGALRRGSGAVFAGAPTARTASLAAPSAAPRSGVTEPEAPKAPAAQKTSAVGKGVIAAVAVLAVAGALLAAPAFGLAASGGFAVSALAYAHPLASIAAAVIGAVYGLVVARKPDGSSPGTADVLASVIRHAIIAGAGTYIAVDLAAVYLLGLPPLAISPLPVTLATAAMAQGAFQGKFADPATSPADRILGAFPAVAGALGLNIGIFLAAPNLILSAAIGAMSVTGAAAAVYAAVYQPGKSAADGPAAMARGFVLQGLMTGLALAMSNPYMAAPFAALALWGFWDVLSTTLQALAARLPEPVRRALRLK